MIERSLEVKLSTIWADESRDWKSQRREKREEKREEKRRAESLHTAALHDFEHLLPCYAHGDEGT